ASRGRSRPKRPRLRKLPRRLERTNAEGLLDRACGGKGVPDMSASSSHRIDILTLFPAILDGYLDQSILSRAIAARLVSIERFNIRDWAEGKHKQVDDRPFGGGPGMVLMAPPVVAAAEAVREIAQPIGRLILLSPQGRRLDQTLVAELALEPR